MKDYTLYLTVRVDVKTDLKRLFEVITELERNATFHIGSTDHVWVQDTEILKTDFFTLKKKEDGTPN